MCHRRRRSPPECHLCWCRRRLGAARAGAGRVGRHLWGRSSVFAQCSASLYKTERQTSRIAQSGIRCAPQVFEKRFRNYRSRFAPSRHSPHRRPPSGIPIRLPVTHDESSGARLPEPRHSRKMGLLRAPSE